MRIVIAAVGRLKQGPERELAAEYCKRAGKVGKVALTGNSPQPAPTQHIVGDLPRISAGSPTYPLDMFAVLSADHKFLTIAVVNATDSEQKFSLNVSGAHLIGKATLWRMTGKNLDAANHVGQTPQVEVKETAIREAPTSVSVAPISINIYRFPVAQ